MKNSAFSVCELPLFCSRQVLPPSVVFSTTLAGGGQSAPARLPHPVSAGLRDADCAMREVLRNAAAQVLGAGAEHPKPLRKCVQSARRKRAEMRRFSPLSGA